MDTGLITPETALVARAQNRLQELPHMLIAVALYEANFDWAQAYCLSLVQHPDENIRGNAMLAFGHLARRFSKLAEELKPIIQAALADPSALVRGQAMASADDLEQFLGWRLFKDVATD